MGFKRDLNVLLLLFVVFVGVFPVSAASAGNQSVSVGCNVQPYIGIDVNPNFMTWGNLTPGVAAGLSSITTTTDDSNVPIATYFCVPEPFSGPETINQSIILYYGSGSPVCQFTTWAVPVNGTSIAHKVPENTDLIINGTHNNVFALTLPLGVLPGDYNTTFYEYCQEAS